jgi:hypothetical protein
MTKVTLEERVTALEKEMEKVKALRSRVRYGVTGRTNPQLIETLFGVFANDPEAEEVAHAIAAERERERAQSRQAREADDAAG